MFREGKFERQAKGCNENSDKNDSFYSSDLFYHKDEFLINFKKYSTIRG